MAINTDIENALSDKTTLLGTLFTPPILIELPNNAITPPDHGVWLKVIHLKNTVANNGWGDTDEEHPGIWQIMVTHRPNEGSIPAMTIADVIVAHFAKGTILRSGVAIVKIEEKPSVLSLLEDGHKIELPVSIRYRCFG